MKKIAISALAVILLGCITSTTHAQTNKSIPFDAGISFSSGKHEGIQTKIFYNKKGSQVGMIRYYFEQQLPNDVKHLVKATYYDFTIFLVTEVTVGNKTVYLVKIKDETCTKTIRVMDREIEVLEEFKNL